MDSQDRWDLRKGGAMLDDAAKVTEVFKSVDGFEVQVGYIEGIVYNETKFEILLATTTDSTMTRLLSKNAGPLDKPPFYVRAWGMRMPWDNEEPTNTTNELYQKIQNIGHLGTYGESVKKKACEMLSTGAVLWKKVEKSRRSGPPRKHYDLAVQHLVIPRHRPLEKAQVFCREEQDLRPAPSLGSAGSAEDKEEGLAEYLSTLSSPALDRLQRRF